MVCWWNLADLQCKTATICCILEGTPRSSPDHNVRCIFKNFPLEDVPTSFGQQFWRKLKMKKDKKTWKFVYIAYRKRTSISQYCSLEKWIMELSNWRDLTCQIHQYFVGTFPKLQHLPKESSSSSRQATSVAALAAATAAGVTCNRNTIL